MSTQDYASTTFMPCLFDIGTDLREQHDLSKTNPAVLFTLWGQLNTTWLASYRSRSPASLLGTCNATCANAHWGSLGLPEGRHAGGCLGGGCGGPICGVPACENDPETL